MTDTKKGPEKWTTAGVIQHILHINNERNDRAFAFILGAGASVTSGIPAARELSLIWLQELQKFRDPEYLNRSTEEWIKDENIEIPNFEYERMAEFYPNIYDLRFAHDEDAGQAFLESVMVKEEVGPSVGYSIMAQILAGGRHSVVITTNFDHLVSDALLLFTGKEPFVVGHEKLAGFIRPKMRRPLIAKIHRDLLLGPKNSTKDIDKLHEAWSETLRALFKIYTPIVIGYGGNDGTLMGLLSEMRPDDIVGRMIWCYREQDQLRDNVMETLNNLGGIIVPIIGFDELMIQLGQALKLPVVAQQLEEVAHKRGRRLLHQLGDIRKRVIAMLDGEKEREAYQVLDALDQSLHFQIENLPEWWAWELKASSEWDPYRKILIYEDAIAEFNNSPELASGYAKALLLSNRDNEAVQSMQRAYSLDRKFNHGLAWILSITSSPEQEKVKQLFEDAIKMHTNNPNVFLDFAEYSRKYGSKKKTEELFKKALELDPKHAETIISYSIYKIEENNLNKARKLARQAWYLCNQKDYFNAARVALLLGIIASKMNGDDTSALARIKALLLIGFDRPLGRISYQLPISFNTFHENLEDAIHDSKLTTNLENDQVWKDLEPIAPEEPWPEEPRDEEDTNTTSSPN